MTRRVHHNAASGRRGFTLVEVIAALLLIGIVVPVAMRGVSISLSSAANSRRTMEAATLAEAKLSELMASGDWSMAGSSGDFSPDFPQYRWTIESATRDFDTTEIVLRVTWDDHNEERTLSVATMGYQTGTGATGTGSTGGTGSSSTGGTP